MDTTIGKNINWVTVQKRMFVCNAWFSTKVLGSMIDLLGL
jgi:hypothetical protein